MFSFNSCVSTGGLLENSTSVVSVSSKYLIRMAYSTLPLISLIRVRILSNSSRHLACCRIALAPRALYSATPHRPLDHRDLHVSNLREWSGLGFEAGA